MAKKITVAAYDRTKPKKPAAKKYPKRGKKSVHVKGHKRSFWSW